MAIHLLIILLLCLSSSQGLNILFLSHNQKSYVNNHLIIIRELVSRGHTATLVVGSAITESMDIYVRGLEVLSYREHKDRLPFSEVEKTMLGQINEGHRLDDFSIAESMLKNISLIVRGACEDLWNDSQLIKKLKSKQFDVCYLNSMITTSCFELVPYNLSIPFITESPVTLTWYHRIPNLPSFVPLPLIQASDKMTFWQRALNLIAYIVIEFVLQAGAYDTSLLKKYAPGVGSWGELFHSAQFYIVERDHLMEWPQPTMPNLLFSPGMTFGPAKPLPNHLNSIMESAKNGVIYMSFGSIFSGISPNFIKKYLKAFQKLDDSIPVIFSFKGNVSQLDDMPKNVRVFPWVPQNDILGHEKTRVFINHGGHRGQLEALYHGVPMVTTGFDGEQFRNGYRIEHHGFGLSLDTYNFTPDELADAIMKVMYYPGYRQRIKKRSEILKAMPKHPREEISDWIEHIARFGGDHLRSHAMDMPLYEFLMLNVLLLFSVAFWVILWVQYRILKALISCCFEKVKQDKLKKS